MPGKASIQPNNAASAAGDYVERIQVIDASGALVSVLASGGPVDTELPAAAALTDSDANPTAPYVAAANMMFEASTWRRMQSCNFGDAQVLGKALFTHAWLFNGASFDRQRGANVFKPFASTAITAGTGMTLWTPAASKKFRLMGWLISSSAAGQLIFGDNAVGTVIARSEAVAAAGVSREDSIGNGILSAVANNVLKLDGPTGNVAGMVWGTEE